MKQWIVLCLLLACQGPFPGARFDRPEVIGTRRTVMLAESLPHPVRHVFRSYCEPTPFNYVTPRIAPRRGDTVRIEWLTAAPTIVGPTSWSFVVCEADGLTCTAPPLLTATQATPSEEPIVFDLPIPLDFSGEQLTVLGAVCFGGPAVSELADDIDDGCQGEGLGSLLHALVDIEAEGTDRPNTQPVIDSVLLNGEPLEEEAVIGGGPCSETLPVVHVGDQVDLQVWISDCSVDVRDVVEQLFGDVYMSDGAFPRSTGLERTEPMPPFDVEWGWYRAVWELDPTPPAEAVPAAGHAVSLTVVVNDEYGGDDVRRAGFCLIP